MTGNSLRYVTGVLALAVSAMAASSAIAADFTWKMQSIWNPGTVNQAAFERFAQNVRDMTGGRIEIETLPVGAVVGYTETLDAVATGILQGQHTSPSYFVGKEPALQICNELSGAFESPYQAQLWFEYGGGTELCREVYAQFNMYYVGPVWFGQESLPAKRPIRTIGEVAGIKIRSPEGMPAAIWRRLGAGVVTLPGSEVYSALEQGLIDAADWGTLSMNQDLGFHRVAPFPLYPGFHSMPAADLAVNLDAWNALPDDLKAIVETATKEFSRDMVQSIEMNDRGAIAAAVAGGADLISWSGEDRDEFRRVARIEWEAFAEKSPLARKLIDSQVAFLNQLGLID